MAPRPVSAEYARQRNRQKAKAYRERIRQQKQFHDRQADVQTESADCIDECSQPIQETSIETPFAAYEESNQIITQPTATAHTSVLPDSPRCQSGVEDREPTTECLGDPTNAPGPTCQNVSEVLGGSEQLPSQEQDSSSTDPILIRREQTRLRVQRYRARQHRLRIGAATVTTDSTITTGSSGQDDGLFGLQNLTLDEVPQLNVPTGCSPIAPITSVGGGNIESHPNDQADWPLAILSEDETSSSCDPDLGMNRPSETGSLPRIGAFPPGYGCNQTCSGLDRFIQAAKDQGSEARIASLDGLITVYDQVFELFFNLECNCTFNYRATIFTLNFAFS
ncbi:hypothetical protein AUP68_10963 [Ilyonectria robusta]